MKSSDCEYGVHEECEGHIQTPLGAMNANCQCGCHN